MRAMGERWWVVAGFFFVTMGERIQEQASARQDGEQHKRNQEQEHAAPVHQHVQLRPTPCPVAGGCACVPISHHLLL